jgi:hypothetical protein
VPPSRGEVVVLEVEVPLTRYSTFKAIEVSAGKKLFGVVEEMVNESVALPSAIQTVSGLILVIASSVFDTLMTKSRARNKKVPSLLVFSFGREPKIQWIPGGKSLSMRCLLVVC